MNILLFEDDFSWQRLLQIELEEEGHSVTVYGDGSVLRDPSFNIDKFDVVITDMEMPVDDGSVVIELVTTRDAELPILLHSFHYDGFFGGELWQLADISGKYPSVTYHEKQVGNTDYIYEFLEQVEQMYD